MIVATTRLIRLALGAFVAIWLSAASAADRDFWTQLGTVDRSNVYTFVLRDRTCDRGQIIKLDRSTLVIEAAATDKQKASRQTLTISRDSVLRVGEGADLHEILFSGRSSWGDLQASVVGPREGMRILLKSGQQLDVVPTSKSTSELTFKSDGKEVIVPKLDVSKVLYVRFKPLSASYRYLTQEAPFLALFSPKTWQYALKMNATMAVLIYDSALPEDNSPVRCSQP